MLLRDLDPPGGILVAPGLDRVDVAGVAGEREGAGPAVVVDEPHRLLVPVRLLLGAVLDHGRELVVPVDEDVGLDGEHVADDALDREAAAIELGRHPLDRDAVGSQLLEPPLALLGMLGHERGLGHRAQEDPHRQRIEGDRAAGHEGLRRDTGRGVLETGDPAAGGGQQRSELDPVGARQVGVDHRKCCTVGRQRRAGIEPEQAHDPAVGGGHTAQRAVGGEGRRRCLEAVGLGDEPGEVDPALAGFLGPVLGPGLDRVEPAAAAILEAHRHQHAGGGGQGIEVAGAVEPGDLVRLLDVEGGGEAGRVVVFREGHRGRDPAQLLLLVQEPAVVEVPPAAAVQDQVEAAAGEGPHLLERAAQRCRHEDGVRIALAQGGEELAPQVRRDLVGGTAAEAGGAQLQIVAGELDEVLHLPAARARTVEVELGQVGHHPRPARVGGVGQDRGDELAVAPAEPLGMLAHQLGIARRVRQRRGRASP